VAEHVLRQRTLRAAWHAAQAGTRRAAGPAGQLTELDGSPIAIAKRRVPAPSSGSPSSTCSAAFQRS